MGRGRFIWMSDSHDGEGGVNPLYFLSAAKWAAANASKRNIAAFLHTGDCGYTAGTDSAHMAALAGMPFFVAMGNHDYNTGNIDGTRSTSIFDAAIPLSSLQNVQAEEAPGHTVNYWSLIPIGGVTYGVMCLEFGPRAAVMAWADAVLAANPTVPFIILTHSYLYTSNARDDSNSPNNPTNSAYGLGSDVNTGSQMWTGCFLNRSNVRMVFSGHHYFQTFGYPLGAYKLDVRGDGSRCHQFGAAWHQWYHSVGGSPYFVEVEVDHDRNTIYTRPWSPDLNMALQGANVLAQLT